VLLALVWAIVLIPSLLRPRLQSSPVNGVRDFERRMGILASARRRQGTSGRWIMVPKPDVTAPKRRRSRLIRKRRQTFERLLVAAAGTFVLGLIPGMHWFLLLNAAVDVGVLLYVSQLLKWKRQEHEPVPTSGSIPEVREPAHVPAGLDDDTAPHRATGR
jgi:hypothetical protein